MVFQPFPGLTFASDDLERVCRSFHVRALAVFGSFARGNPRPGSDLDLLVEFEPPARVGLLALSRLRNELASVLGRSVDLVPVGGLKPGLRQEVLGTSRPLYAA
jgi:hypothetical protein